MNDINISVIVCTYNRADSFMKFMESFYDQEGDFSDCEFLVVDNNSTDKTKTVCDKFSVNKKIKLKYIYEKTQGLSFARNTAVQNASGEIIAFIDDDVIVDKHWLAMVKKLANSYHEYAMFGGKVIPLWENGKPSWVVFHGSHAIIQSVFPSHDYGDDVKEYPIRTQKNPIGANMMVRSEVFTKYGLFRTDLGVSGTSLKTGGLHEDTEFIWRLLAKGEKALYYPLAIVSHFVPEERSSKSYIKKWYFKSGASFTRMKHDYYDKQEYSRLYGIPRWIIRKFIKPCFWLIFSVNSNKRFFYYLRFYRLLGTVSEFFYHFMSKKNKEKPQALSGNNR